MVADRLSCDQILYVPAARNPLKNEPPLTPVDHRLAMLALALADTPGARISTLELDRAGPSYTVDTLEALQAELGGHVELRLLIGADHALQFRSWKQWRHILELAKPAVMLRPPLTREAFLAQLEKMYDPDEAHQWYQWAVQLPLLDISSSDVRRRLDENSALDDVLDPAIIAYIRSHGLYGAATALGTGQND
jgi:nicotinate-nucleotide adenylyltransferase